MLHTGRPTRSSVGASTQLPTPLPLNHTPLHALSGVQLSTLGPQGREDSQEGIGLNQTARTPRPLQDAEGEGETGREGEGRGPLDVH